MFSFALKSDDVLVFLRCVNGNTLSYIFVNKNHTKTMQIKFRTVPNAFCLEMILSDLVRA